MNSHSNYLKRKEINTIPPKKNARIKVALVYPNSYYVGMSNLGLHTIYHLLNKREDALCERFFYEQNKELLSVETRRSLKGFDVLAFSVSYELDYVNFFHILKQLEMVQARVSRPIMPLVIVGGIVNAYNFMPLSKFSDAIFSGEAEETLSVFMDKLSCFSQINTDKKKDKFLREIAQIKGIFVPGMSDPQRVEVQMLADVNLYPASSGILTLNTEFSNTFLIEISRGCPWQCNFCITGSIFSKFRPRNLEVLKKQINFGLQYTSKIGLIGAAVSDYPEIDKLVSFLQAKKVKLSVSSLRIESTTASLLKALGESGQNTVTFAPEAGTDKLRKFLNKKISNDEILEKIELAKNSGIKKIKLYFMIGLPQEEKKDIEAIVELAKAASCLLPIKVNLGIFIPKPKTPFAQEKFMDKKNLFQRIQFLRRNLSNKKNTEFNAVSIKEAMQEAQFSWADENFFDACLRS